MAYFQLPQKKRRELFTGPDTSGSNKLFLIIGLLGLFGFIGSGLSWYTKKSDQSGADIKLPAMTSQSPSGSGIAASPNGLHPDTSPPPTQIPILSGSQPNGSQPIPTRVRKKIDLNPAILDEVTDTYNENSGSLPIEELSQVEHYPYLNVVNYVLSHTEEEIKSNLTIPHPKRHPEVTFWDMINTPAAVRGATVHISGRVRLYGYSPYEADFQEDSGLPGFWYGYLFDKDHHQYAFRILEGGDKFKTLEGDDEAMNQSYTIEMNAVFLKKIWIANRQGKAEGRALYSIMPLLIAKTAETYTPPAIDLLSLEAILFLSFGTILVFILGIVLSKEIGSNIRRRKYRVTSRAEAAKEEIATSEGEAVNSQTED